MIETRETNTRAINDAQGLPHGWELIPLAELCIEIVGGGTPSRHRAEYFGGDIVWITPSDLDANKPVQEVFTSQIKITAAGLNGSSAKIVPAGTVLFSSRATIGKIAIAGVPLATNQGFVNFVCKNERLNNHYLAWCLRSLTEEIRKLAGSTTYLEVSRGDLRRFKIPIPFPNDPLQSLDIQHRIASRIEANLADLDEASKTLDVMKHNLDQVMEAVLKEVMEDLEKYYPSTTLGNLISNHVIRSYSGGTPPTNDQKYWDGPIPWVSPKDMKRWYIDDSQEHVAAIAVEENKTKLIPRGTVLLVVRGMILARDLPIGINLREVTINQDMKAFHCTDDFVPEYLGYMLRARAPFILGKVEIAGHGTRRLKMETLEQVAIPNAPKEVQMHVIAHLDATQSELGTMQNTLKENDVLLEQVEQAILHEAFRGDL